MKFDWVFTNAGYVIVEIDLLNHWGILLGAVILIIQLSNYNVIYTNVIEICKSELRLLL